MSQLNSSFSDSSSAYSSPRDSIFTSPTNSVSSSHTWDSECLDSPAANDIAKQLDDSFQFDHATIPQCHLKEKENGSTTSLPSPTKKPDDSVVPPAPPPKSRRKHAAFIFITCIAQFLSLCALCQTISPLLILAKDFKVQDYGNLSWFSAAYSLSVGTFILPAGRLGDMYGHKKIYLIGWLWFGVWSLITGFSYSSNHIMFSACRGLQGIGPALLVPNALALIGRTLPIGQQRMLGFACFGACGPTGAAVGAVFSALIAEEAWWPWMFWVLAIVCLVVGVLAYFILPPTEVQAPVPGLVKAKPPKFDYLGTATGVSGLILINVALNQAPLVLWKTPYVGILLGLGCLLMLAFILVEMYFTSDPLIPIRGLGKDALFSLACIVTGWASHGIWWYYLYLVLEHLRGHSALLSSAQTFPVAITGVCFAFSTVWLIQRVGVSWVMFIAMTCFMLGVLLLATMPIDQTYWAQTFVSLLVMPGAMNLSYPAANILMSSALPKEKQGVSASLVSTLVNYSISCGLGLAGTVSRYTGDAYAVKHGVVTPPLQSEPDAELKKVNLVGFRASFWFAVALSALGMVVASVFIVVTERRKRVQRRSAVEAQVRSV